MATLLHAAPRGARHPTAALRTVPARLHDWWMSRGSEPRPADTARLGDHGLRDIGLDPGRSAPDWSRPWTDRPWANG